ncbi:hypothetical protein D3C72_1535120 [compost metagenome]
MRIVVIAADGAAPAQPDLTGNTVRNPIARVIDDLQLDTGGRPASGRQTPRFDRAQMVGLGQGADRLGAFGGTVQLEKNVAETLLGLLELDRTHRGRTVIESLQTGQIVMRRLRQFQ